MTSHLFSICAMFGEVMVIFKYHKVLSISTKILLLCEVEFMNIGNL